MMDLSLNIGMRDLTDSDFSLPGGYTIDKMIWNAQGGPSEAEVTLPRVDRGSAEWEGLLRRPVVIRGAAGEPVWWGYVAVVDVYQRGVMVTYSLDGVYNYVRYHYNKPDGARVLGATSDAGSVSMYGYKEIYYNYGYISAARAAALAKAALIGRGRPQKRWTSTKETGNFVKLHLRGWMETLGWRQFIYNGQAFPQAYPDGYTPAAYGNIGYSATSVKGWQVLDPVDFSVWKPVYLNVYACKVGAPTDYLQADLFAVDASGLPTGASLATVQFQPSTNSLALYQLTFPDVGSVLSGAPVGVQFTRTGAVGSTNYWRVGVYEYTAGSDPTPYKNYLFWNGTAWTTRSPVAVCPLSIEGQVETADYAAWLATFGQFFPVEFVIDASGEWTSPVNNQSVVTYLREFMDALSVGASDGSKLVAKVDQARTLFIRKAPAITSPACIILPGGELRGWRGQELAQPGEAAGTWAVVAAHDAGPVLWVDKVTWENGRVTVGS